MIRIRSQQILSCFACLCLLASSCVPKLPQKAPEVNLNAPKDFPNQNKKGNKANLIDKNWKLFFQDKQLVALIDSALKNNQQLNILTQEINVANNEIMARQGQYIPKVGVGAGYELEKSAEFSRQGVTDDNAGLPSKLRNRQFGLNASWEVDIWNKLHNFAKSAYYEYLASIEGRNFAVTELVAEIANDYYELMALDNELDIIKKYITTLKQAEHVAQLQQVAGRTTSLAVKRFSSEVLKNQSRKKKIQQQIIVTENHLNTLLGRLPQPIKRSSKNFTKIQMQEVATGIPSDLLDNRPDLKQAALKLEAAKINVTAVKAEFYPSLNIDAALGYQSFNSHHFLNTPQSVFYNAAGSLTAPLLNRNAIKADYYSANNKQIEAIYDYEWVFIKAFAEVSNQLAAVQNFNQMYVLKSKQTKKLSESFDISNILYKAARVDYLESLLTRRDYLESQLELIEAKQQQLSAYIGLYKSLGGGWRDDASPKSNKKG